MSEEADALNQINVVQPARPEILSFFSPTFTKVFLALGKAQSEFSTVVKNKINTYYNNAPYADLASLFEATKPALSKNGLVISQFPVSENVDVDRPVAGVVTLLMHESGEYIVNRLLLPAKGRAKDNAPKYDSQTVAASVTYARRIAYQAILSLAGEEEDDGNEVSQEERRETRTPPKTNKPPARSQSEQPDLTPQVLETTDCKIGQEQYNSYIEKSKKLVTELTKAGLKPSAGKTVGQKFKDFALKTVGKPDLKEFSVGDWESILKLTEKIIANKELDTIWKEETKAE